MVMYVVTTLGVGPGTSKRVVMICVDTLESCAGCCASSIGMHCEYHSLFLSAQGFRREAVRRGGGVLVAVVVAGCIGGAGRCVFPVATAAWTGLDGDEIWRVKALTLSPHALR